MAQPLWLLWIGFSLLAPLALVWARARSWFPSDRMKLLFSAGLWSISAVDVYILLVPGRRTLSDIGFGSLTWVSAVRGVGIGVLGLGLAGAVLAMARRGGSSAPSRDAVAKLGALPLWAKLTTLVTVSATEELLFRAFPIGVAAFSGSPLWFVAAVSVLTFVLGHAQWGRSHAPFVTVIAVFITGGFLAFRDAWAVVIAHALIDVPPLLLSGAMLRKMNDDAGVSNGRPTPIL